MHENIEKPAGGHGEKTATYEPRKEVSTETSLAGALILDF